MDGDLFSKYSQPIICIQWNFKQNHAIFIYFYLFNQLRFHDMYTLVIDDNILVPSQQAKLNKIWIKI